jgi:hypothetical protein
MAKVACGGRGEFERYKNLGIITGQPSINVWSPGIQIPVLIQAATD